MIELVAIAANHGCGAQQQNEDDVEVIVSVLHVRKAIADQLVELLQNVGDDEDAEGDLPSGYGSTQRTEGAVDEEESKEEGETRNCLSMDTTK